MPRSCGLMRPSGEMAQASVKIRAAPPTARLPRWTRCQSLAKPSLLEYWHMGETTMRLRRMTSRICNSSNRFMADWMMGAGQKWQEKRRVRSTRQRQDCHRDAGAQRKAKDLTQSAQRKPENTEKDDGVSRFYSDAQPRKRGAMYWQQSASREIGVPRQRRRSRRDACLPAGRPALRKAAEVDVFRVCYQFEP